MNFINMISSFLSTFERTIYKKPTGNKIIPLGKIIPLIDYQSGDIETGLLHGTLRDECRIFVHDYKWVECKWEECKWEECKWEECNV